MQFLFALFTRFYYDDKTKDGRLDEMCSTHGKMRDVYIIKAEKRKGEGETTCETEAYMKG
jgi:hypothetical protein